jgi:hypothetical protein
LNNDRELRNPVSIQREKHQVKNSNFNNKKKNEFHSKIFRLPILSLNSIQISKILFYPLSGDI